MTTGHAIELEVQSRPIGKHISRKLRREKRTPGVLYGAKIKNHVFSIEEKWVVKYATSKYENTLFKIKSENKDINGMQVLMKDIVTHPVSRTPIHIDLLAVDLMKKIVVSVALKFEGKAIGLQDGGLLQVIRHDIEVECLPTDIPESLSVNVSSLGIHDSLHVNDLKLPSNVKAMTDPNSTLVTVTVVQEEKEKPSSIDEEETKEPEVISKGKKEDGSPDSNDDGNKTS